MLYHKDIYFKPYFNQVCYKLLSREKQLTKHCVRALIDDKISISDFNYYLKRVKHFKYELIEVEELNGSISKFVIRLAYNRKKDICIVFAKSRTDKYMLTVKSIWTNDKSDKHKTLDKNKYFSLTN